ncbi:MAG: hypothetical protein KIS77_09480 [Saprospiraceae bacterium]|nr:hypothetical protein [Saprospiraceae bacterium]
MNSFGGNWTENKIEILVEYAKAYLTIMNVYANKFGWKLMYFDGFAGSGLIVKEKDENRKEIIGAARRIIYLVPPSFQHGWKDEITFTKLQKFSKRYPRRC